MDDVRRATFLAGVRELLDEHPDTRGRELLELPYVTRADRPLRAERLQQLQPVAHRVRHVEPAVPGELGIPLHRVPRRLAGGGQPVEVVGEQTGCALRAGRKSASTPQWISAPPDRNQAPPRAASTGGSATSVMPSTTP